MGEAVLLLTRLSLRAAAGNLMPENSRSRSSPKKLPAAFTEQGVWHLHQKYTQTSSFQEGCKPSLPHLPSMCLEREVLRHSISHPSSGCSSASSLISVLFAGVKTMVPGVIAEKAVPNSTAPMKKWKRKLTCPEGQGEEKGTTVFPLETNSVEKSFIKTEHLLLLFKENSFLLSSK